MQLTRNHVLLFVVATCTAFANDARACERGMGGWTLDEPYAPDCLSINRASARSIEIVNDCSSSVDLTLAGDCTNCYGPDSIAAGDIGLVGFEEDPSVSTGLLVSWEVGDFSGGTTLAYHINVCPEGDGCSAAPPRRTGLAWGYPTLLGAAALFGSRLRRRSRPG